MKKTLMTLTALMSLSLPLAAMEAADTDADGMVTLEELQAMHTDITAEDFAALDVNGDGSLDADEYAAGVDGGLIPAEG
jgi:uncharacterized protein (DUF2141 family)